MDDFSSFDKYVVLKDHKEIANNALMELVEETQKLGLTMHLIYGTALGFVRGDGYIDYDNDIDLIVHGSREEWVTLMKNLRLKGFFVPPDEHDAMHIVKNKIMFDIARRNGEEAKFDHVVYNGVKFNVPHPIESYLREVYGEDWRTPEPSESYRKYADHMNRERLDRKRLWNKIAEEWTLNLKPYTKWQVKERLDFADVCEGDLILDLGCGCGRDTDFFYWLGMNCIGLDFSKKILKVQPSVCGELRYLPFKDEVFDCVWCSSVLKHVAKPDLYNCLAEVKRVLRKNGKFWVGLDEGQGQVNEGNLKMELYDEQSFLSYTKFLGFHHLNTKRIHAWRKFITFLLEKK